jgi:hypothetical protein
MRIENLVTEAGVHCETTTLGVLLSKQGISLSEPMRFGMGEGLSFFYWDTKTLNFPMVLGRSRPLEISKALADNLGLQLVMRETASTRKAWVDLERWLCAGVPVGLKLDCYYLDYFAERVHFPAHIVAAYGIDDENVYVVDTKGAGGCVAARRESIQQARAAKGPMSSRNLSYTLKRRGHVRSIEQAVRSALHNTAQRYLSPSIKNLSYKGIEVLARKMPKWLERTNNPSRDLAQVSMLMETAGTGGALFRNLYRDFLQEAADLLRDSCIAKSAGLFAESALRWKHVSVLIAEAGRRRATPPLQSAAGVLLEVAAIERNAMESLTTLD